KTPNAAALPDRAPYGNRGSRTGPHRLCTTTVEETLVDGECQAPPTAGILAISGGPQGARASSAEGCNPKTSVPTPQKRWHGGPARRGPWPPVAHFGCKAGPPPRAAKGRNGQRRRGSLCNPLNFIMSRVFTSRLASSAIY